MMLKTKIVFVMLMMVIGSFTATAKEVIIANNTGKAMVILPQVDGVADWSNWRGLNDGQAGKFDFDEDTIYSFGFDFDVNKGSIQGGVWSMNGSDLPDDYASFRIKGTGKKAQPTMYGLVN